MKKTTDIEFFDTHCHLQLDDYNSDRQEVVNRLTQKNGGAFMVGINKELSITGLEIAKQHNNIWALIGMHPVRVSEEQSKLQDLQWIEEFLQEEKVIGIGECGYDFFHVDKSNQTEVDRQESAFKYQIELSCKYNLPLMLHIRPSSRTNFDAYEKALQTLDEYKSDLPDYPGNAHFFAADWNIAQEFLKRNFTLSFTGVVTFAQKPYHEVIKNTPLNKILLETDAPYVSPVPFRGQRAEPIHVLQIAEKIAAIKNISIQEVLQTTTQTVIEKFGL